MNGPGDPTGLTGPLGRINSLTPPPRIKRYLNHYPPRAIHASHDVTFPHLIIGDNQVAFGIHHPQNGIYHVIHFRAVAPYTHPAREMDALPDTLTALKHLSDALSKGEVVVSRKNEHLQAYDPLTRTDATLAGAKPCVEYERYGLPVQNTDQVYKYFESDQACLPLDRLSDNSEEEEELRAILDRCVPSVTEEILDSIQMPVPAVLKAISDIQGPPLICTDSPPVTFVPDALPNAFLDLCDNYLRKSDLSSLRNRRYDGIPATKKGLHWHNESDKRRFGWTILLSRDTVSNWTKNGAGGHAIHYVNSGEVFVVVLPPTLSVEHLKVMVPLYQSHFFWKMAESGHSRFRAARLQAGDIITIPAGGIYLQYAFCPAMVSGITFMHNRGILYTEASRRLDRLNQDLSDNDYPRAWVAFLLNTLAFFEKNPSPSSQDDIRAQQLSFARQILLWKQYGAAKEVRSLEDPCLVTASREGMDLSYPPDDVKVIIKNGERFAIALRNPVAKEKNMSPEIKTLHRRAAVRVIEVNQLTGAEDEDEVHVPYWEGLSLIRGRA